MNQPVKKKQIYRKLLASYFLFAIIAIVLVIAFTALIFQVMSNGKAFTLLPQRIITEDGELANTKLLTGVGGWIEELNDDYRVIRVIGSKRTARQHYNENELLMMVGSANVEKDYSMFYESTGEHRYLIYVPEAMNVIYSSNGHTIMPRTRIITIFALLVILLIIEALIFSRYLYKRIQRPLAELTAAAQRTQAGERDADLDFDAEGEFIILRDATNDMIRTIAEQEEENEYLLESQRRLMLELSHDFKTPIATIGACAKALEDDVVSEDEKKKYYQIIQTKADRVSRLTKDILAMLKLNDAEYRPHFERIDICETLRRITSEYYSEITMNDFHLGVYIPDDEIMVDADEELLKRAVFNLLSNAIKYNKTGRQIGVYILRFGTDQVAIRINDDGRPIPSDIREVMFDAFTRDDAARKTTGGTGLGLTITHKIAEQHGGTLAYYYRNGWNVMEIMLPLAKD